MDNLIIASNGNGKQHTPQDAFNQAFNIPTSQDNKKLNTDSDKVHFVLSKIAEYQEKVQKLEAELYSAKVLLEGHKTWAAELVRQIEGEK